MSSPPEFLVSGLDPSELERARMGGGNGETTQLGEPLLAKKAKAYRPRCPGCREDRLNAEREGVFPLKDVFLIWLVTITCNKAVSAHELGHLKCDHGVWLTFANILTMGAYTVPGFDMVAGFLEEQLYRWLRAAELTCDRAALLVVQDPKIKSFLSAYTLFHLGFMVGYMRVAFAYNVCGQRTTRAINPHAYTNETVFVQIWSSACWAARASTTPSARCSTKCRSRLDVHAYTIVLHALSRAGRYERTLELFAELRRQGVAPTLVTYNVVLDVYGRMGRSWPRIVALLDEMRAAGVETDDFTTSTVIAACCRDGLVDEAVASTIELYIEYQKERVHMVDDARLAFELSTVLSKEGIEVCMVPSADRPDDAKFAVPLLESDFDFAIAKLTIRLSSLNDFISCY
ncbi:Pentatricopeptide repeat-containing protein [Zea mays]|uniref:Pentatricopeptide repeat-containing protein n=1 Tax=Zea mays TaxID=4577 RepID=A0A317YC54_MAIZE|nr:Pentatricopeptide repeat-containing protein [Zea mays]